MTRKQWYFNLIVSNVAMICLAIALIHWWWRQKAIGPKALCPAFRIEG